MQEGTTEGNKQVNSATPRCAHYWLPGTTSIASVTGTNLHEVIKTDLIQLKKLKFAAAPTEKRHEKSVRC